MQTARSSDQESHSRHYKYKNTSHKAQDYKRRFASLLCKTLCPRHRVCRILRCHRYLIGSKIRRPRRPLIRGRRRGRFRGILLDRMVKRPCRCLRRADAGLTSTQVSAASAAKPCRCIKLSATFWTNYRRHDKQALFLLYEIQGSGVYAISQASRSWTIRKDMT